MTQIEYKDVEIALDVWGKTGAGPEISKDMALRQAAINAAPSATSIITEVLGREGVSGWQPDCATDLLSLLLGGQVTWRQTGGLLFSWKFTFDVATVRFRRVVSSAAPGQSSGRFCDQCGSPTSAEARFCGSCGAMMPGMAARQDKAASLQATPAWYPTHRIPAGGMPAWNGPDGSGQPASQLAEYLDVVIVSRAGDWAQVSAANGWRGWVDGRKLTNAPTPPSAPHI